MTIFAFKVNLPFGDILHLCGGMYSRPSLTLYTGLFFTLLGMKSIGKRGYREEALGGLSIAISPSRLPSNVNRVSDPSKIFGRQTSNRPTKRVRSGAPNS